MDEYLGLHFKHIEESNIDFIISCRNSPFVKQYFINKMHFTYENQIQWLETNVKTGKAVQFIIIQNDNPIGCVYIRNINRDNASGEFGIYLASVTYQNQGYGSIAIQFITSYAFQTLKLKTLYLRVLADNFAAIKCYLKNGFKVDENRHTLFCKEETLNMQKIILMKKEYTIEPVKESL